MTFCLPLDPFDSYANRIKTWECQLFGHTVDKCTALITCNHYKRDYVGSLCSVVPPRVASLICRGSLAEDNIDRCMQVARRMSTAVERARSQALARSDLNISSVFHSMVACHRRQQPVGFSPNTGLADKTEIFLVFLEVHERKFLGLEPLKALDGKRILL
ncbi:hypothetical protein CDD80_5335 [Ophiocordyceps camponoti-rufipedis]|uniref:Uncharacterized protein n=1 Tax=Ophiocordyceps camponoti-rufipedis TaxID=2004952 RepID=A0A2C5ZJ53_9HYPO|nr:hypothetical protein CDD80_5335 [Ophiocordyceps camponoti-rufipedis]